MNIHEHQAKEIPNKFGIAVLRGGACVILSLSSSVSFFPQHASKIFKRSGYINDAMRGEEKSGR